MTDRDRKAVAIWLVAVCGLIFVMVVLGGVTRLTESGLSMTDWRPVTGWLPPLDAAAWQAEFAKYQASPEFQQINFSMQPAWDSAARRRNRSLLSRVASKSRSILSRAAFTSDRVSPSSVMIRALSPRPLAEPK